jgi:putative peptidoglycan lipid II flippase
MYLALQLPFYLCGILYVRALTSLQRNALTAAVALINATINVGGSVLLMGSLGLSGIAIAATCGYVVASTMAGVFVLLAIRKAENWKNDPARC